MLWPVSKSTKTGRLLLAQRAVDLQRRSEKTSTKTSTNPPHSQPLLQGSASVVMGYQV
jgi:hypothetical protein